MNAGPTVRRFVFPSNLLIHYRSDLIIPAVSLRNMLSEDFSRRESKADPGDGFRSGDDSESMILIICLATWGNREAPISFP